MGLRGLSRDPFLEVDNDKGGGFSGDVQFRHNYHGKVRHRLIFIHCGDVREAAGKTVRALFSTS
jgi:hypothetical protein